jgi:hypothetical protein
MAIEEQDLTEAEIAALRWIKNGTGTEVWRIEAKTGKDMFGNPVPGMAIFRKLEKKGLCYPTVEEPVLLADGEPFEFSSTMELTDEGLRLARGL